MSIHWKTEHVEVGILPQQWAKNLKKTLYILFHLVEKKKLLGIDKESLTFHAYELLFLYVTVVWVNHACWSITKQLAPRVAFSPIGRRFKFSFLFIFAHFLWCGLNDHSSDTWHRRERPAIERIQVGSSVCWPATCLLPVKHLEEHMQRLPKLVMVEYNQPSCCFRACRKRWEIVDQVFPVAVSWILHQWHAS